jgi:hypothetical protein
MRWRPSRLLRRLLRGVVPRAIAGAAALFLLTAAGTGHAQQPDSVSVHLHQGWNNVPYFGSPAEPSEALTAIEGKYRAVWFWDALGQRYLVHDTAGETADELTEMLPGRCYWIVATEEADLEMPLPSAGVVPALAPGWNNFVYTGEELPVADALELLHGRFDSVFSWDPLVQRFRSYRSPHLSGGLAALKPFGCYWLYFS